MSESLTGTESTVYCFLLMNLLGQRKEGDVCESVRSAADALCSTQYLGSTWVPYLCKYLPRTAAQLSRTSTAADAAAAADEIV